MMVLVINRGEEPVGLEDGETPLRPNEGRRVPLAVFEKARAGDGGAGLVSPDAPDADAVGDEDEDEGFLSLEALDVDDDANGLATLSWDELVETARWYGIAVGRKGRDELIAEIQGCDE